MHRIGHMTLDAVIESEEPFADPFQFLPDARQEVIDANAHWLKPRHIVPETGRMNFCFQSFVLRTGRYTVLVDSCIGNDKNRPHRPTWHRRQGSYIADLARLGVHPAEVDFVLCTHLHGDHVGWNTRLENGRWVPTFPNAKYIMARTECDFWEKRYREKPDEPRNFSFGDSVLPVLEANKAVLVDTDHEIARGIWFEPAPGHTPGNVVVNVRSNGHRAVLLGDTIHHVLQIIEPDWSTWVCEDKAAARASRRALLEKYVDTDTLIAPAHFPTPTLGHFVRRGDGFGYRMVDE
jgi:glyoxylase-like metal-dependent hydrolase (beta-lactamase superfamily II)